MTNRLPLWILNIAGFIFVILMNFLANALPFGGRSTGELSDKYPTLFTPAGFTFSIWGIIYLALLLFIVYQSLPHIRNRPVLKSISIPFLVNCISNGLWLVFWHYELLWLSLIDMFVILGSLIVIYSRLRSFRKEASGTEKILMHVPFSIYIGWITVATIANITIVQFDMGWNNSGLDAISWTLIKLGAAGAIAAWMIYRFGDFAYVLVIAWASFGIMTKQSATPEVAGAAGMLIVICTMAATLELVRKIRHSDPGRTDLKSDQ